MTEATRTERKIKYVKEVPAITKPPISRLEGSRSMKTGLISNQFKKKKLHTKSVIHQNLNLSQINKECIKIKPTSKKLTTTRSITKSSKPKKLCQITSAPTQTLFNSYTHKSARNFYDK